MIIYPGVFAPIVLNPVGLLNIEFVGVILDICGLIALLKAG
jgi:hypothetical protein